MGIIYSNVPPLMVHDNHLVLSDYIAENIQLSDSLIIATGYASKKGLMELDRIVRASDVKSVILVLGMYGVEGIPESIYNTALTINHSWKCDKIGEIRITKSIKYHGKTYAFYKDSKVASVVIGSHNLGALATEASNLRQYELSMYSSEPNDCICVDQHLKQVICSPISECITDIADLKVIREENEKLRNVEGVEKVMPEYIEQYMKAKTDISFEIPLKVPGIPGSSEEYMGSNINKCYAKGRLNSRTGVVSERGWWETEIIVGSNITSNADYPEKDVPFYVITDDGWKFLAHVSGDHKKNFESHGDLKILGYWLKGRLVAAGIVEPVDIPSLDLQNKKNSGLDAYSDCKGVITYKKLLQYGRTFVTLTKTGKTLADGDGISRDVWMLSFLPKRKGF